MGDHPAGQTQHPCGISVSPRREDALGTWGEDTFPRGHRAGYAGWGHFPRGPTALGTRGEGTFPASGLTAAPIWYKITVHPLLKDLVDLLALERIDRNLFRGRSQDLGWGAIFGGQVLGQALSAATQTVTADRPVHSAHGYFMRAGEVNRPIVYQVDRLRDGRSFSTRRVSAVQEGEAIFTLAASFQVEESGFEHQDAKPDVPAPEDLRSERDLALAFASMLPEAFRARATADRPIEIRPVDLRNPWRRPRRRPIAVSGTAWSTVCPTIPRCIGTSSRTRPTSRFWAQHWTLTGSAS